MTLPSPFLRSLPRSLCSYLIVPSTCLPKACRFALLSSWNSIIYISALVIPPFHLAFKSLFRCYLFTELILDHQLSTLWVALILFITFIYNWQYCVHLTSLSPNNMYIPGEQRFLSAVSWHGSA